MSPTETPYTQTSFDKKFHAWFIDREDTPSMFEAVTFTRNETVYECVKLVEARIKWVRKNLGAKHARYLEEIVTEMKELYEKT